VKSPAGTFTDDLLAFLLAEQRPPDRALVADPALGRPGLGRADDGERLLAVVAGDLDGRADLDVVGRVVLVDDRSVLDERLGVWIRPSTNACSFFASSYSAFSLRSPCSFASWIR